MDDTEVGPHIVFPLASLLIPLRLLFRPPQSIFSCTARLPSPPVQPRWVCFPPSLLFISTLWVFPEPVQPQTLRYVYCSFHHVFDSGIDLMLDTRALKLKVTWITIAGDQYWSEKSRSDSCSVALCLESLPPRGHMQHLITFINHQSMNLYHHHKPQKHVDVKRRNSRDHCPCVLFFILRCEAPWGGFAAYDYSTKENVFIVDPLEGLVTGNRIWLCGKCVISENH